MDALREEKTRMLVKDWVGKTIAEKFNVDLDEIVPEASFVDDLGMDSLGVVELQMLIEEKFSIVISDDKMDKIHTVKDIVEHVNKYCDAGELNALP